MHPSAEITEPVPTRDERHRAACIAMDRAAVLMRFAARYTGNVHDAEDAYQRALVIALTRAPTVERRPFLGWFFAVLRHEAIAVARSRGREGPGSGDDLATVVGETVAAPGSVEEVVWSRHRYRALLEALAGLTESQRHCLILQSAGADYRLIAEVTGYSHRKIERSLAEGRRGLTRWEVDLVAGSVCIRLGDLIRRAAAEEANRRERLMVSRHIRHCGACRARLQRERQTRERLAALAPLPLLVPVLTRPPDPSPALAWWDRVSGGLTVHTGSAVNALADLPASGIGRIGAGSAAVVLAAAAGIPLIVDRAAPPPDRPERPAAPLVAAARPPVPPSPRPLTTPVVVAPRSAPVRRAAPPRPRARGAAAAVGATRPAPRPAPTRAPAPRAAAPPASQAPAAPNRQSIALEFGP